MPFQRILKFPWKDLQEINREREMKSSLSFMEAYIGSQPFSQMVKDIFPVVVRGFHQQKKECSECNLIFLDLDQHFYYYLITQWIYRRRWKRYFGKKLYETVIYTVFLRHRSNICLLRFSETQAK